MLVPFLNTGLQDVSQTSWDQSLQAVWAKWNRSHCPKIYSWQGCCWLTRRGHKHHSNHAITSKLFCLISALMQKSGQYLLCLLWPPWSIIKASLWLSTPCFPPISACLDGQGNIETWMLGATGPLAAGTPASKWSQGYSQSTCQVCVGEVHLRERDSARGWREEFLGFSSEGKTSALHSEEKGVQCRARSQTLIPEAHLEMLCGTKKKPVGWF